MRRHSNLATGKWQSDKVYVTEKTDCTQNGYSLFIFETEGNNDKERTVQL